MRTTNSPGGAKGRPTKSLLSPADEELLTRAIRAGISREPDPAASKRVWLWVLVGFLVVMLEVGAFHWLATTRQSQRLAASADDLASLEHISLAHSRGTGSWTVTPGTSRSLAVLNPGGTVHVSLPVRPSQCGRIAGDLKRVCRSGARMDLEPPVDLEWSQPMRLVTRGRGVKQLDLALRWDRSSPDGLDLGVVSRQEAALRLCFSQSITRSQLTIRDAIGRTSRVAVSPRGIVDCGEGMHLVIASRRGEDHEVSLLFGRVSDIAFTTTSTREDIESFTGKLSLVEVSSHVIDRPIRVAIEASPGRELNTTLSKSASESHLALRSGGVRSVVTEDGELLPTLWERYPQLVLPVLTSIFGALALPSFSAGILHFRDWILKGKR